MKTWKHRSNLTLLHRGCWVLTGDVVWAKLFAKTEPMIRPNHVWFAQFIIFSAVDMAVQLLEHESCKDGDGKKSTASTRLESSVFTFLQMLTCFCTFKHHILANTTIVQIQFWLFMISGHVWRFPSSQIPPPGSCEQVSAANSEAFCFGSKGLFHSVPVSWALLRCFLIFWNENKGQQEWIFHITIKWTIYQRRAWNWSLELIHNESIYQVHCRVYLCKFKCCTREWSECLEAFTLYRMQE